jgi:hypothetical protein
MPIQSTYFTNIFFERRMDRNATGSSIAEQTGKKYAEFIKFPVFLIHLYPITNSSHYAWSMAILQMINIL